MTAEVIHQTADYTVTIETSQSEQVAPERRRAYFIRHKQYQVIEHTTPMLYEAIVHVEATQKALDTVRRGDANTSPSSLADLN